MQNCLYHHGIKGQKWGLRRFQNPDGTLTALGKARYFVGEGVKKLREGYSKAASEHRVRRAVRTGKRLGRLTDEELQRVKSRLDLERSVKSVYKEARPHAVRKLIAEVASDGVRSLGRSMFTSWGSKLFAAKPRTTILDPNNLKGRTDDEIERGLKRLKSEKEIKGIYDKMSSEKAKGGDKLQKEMDSFLKSAWEEKVDRMYRDVQSSKRGKKFVDDILDADNVYDSYDDYLNSRKNAISHSILETPLSDLKIDELAHHGIKGQKWGVKHGPPYPLGNDVSTGSSLKKSKDSEHKSRSYENSRHLENTFYKNREEDHYGKTPLYYKIKKSVLNYVLMEQGE